MDKDGTAFQFKRRTSIRAKLFIIILATSWSAVIVSAYFSFSWTINGLMHELRQELMTTARTSAALIDGDKHRQLELSGDERSPVYSEIKAQLKSVKKANPKVRYIYTMVKTGRPNVWEFIVDAEEDPKFVSHLGDPYNVSEFPEMQKAFEGAAADTKLTTDKWGTWLSGYAPVYDSSGQAVAIVGIDMSAKNVQEAIAGRYRALAVPLLVMLTMPALVGYLVSRRISRPLTDMIRAAKRIAEGNYDQRIDVATRDELGELASAMNTMAQNISDRVGTAESTAIIDGLTDLYNHRYFQERLSEELKRADKFDRKLSLLIVDVDDFGQFNSVNGHDYGDIALRQMGELIKASVRDTDIVARYGGEAFAVILPESSEDEALLTAERISMMISATQFDNKHNLAFTLTVGIGIAHYPKHGQNSEELINASHHALTAAKKLGNSQIVAYGDEDRHQPGDTGIKSA